MVAPFTPGAPRKRWHEPTVYYLRNAALDRFLELAIFSAP